MKKILIKSGLLIAVVVLLGAISTILYSRYSVIRLAQGLAVFSDPITASLKDIQLNRKHIISIEWNIHYEDPGYALAPPRNLTWNLKTDKPSPVKIF